MEERPGGLPSTSVAVAAIRGALWAESNRQATLLITMVVQQRLASIEELSAALGHVRRDRRRGLLYELLVDLHGGVSSVTELDVIRGLRERGLPLPDVQVLRQTRRGRYFLDLRWARYAVVVEVDGVQHSWAENIVADSLRHNEIALGGDVVLRLPVLGLRLCPEDFFGQIRDALIGRGWREVAA